MGLNKRQKLFVAEYIIDLNATQAAIRAGYSEKTAYSLGGRLLKNVEIQKAISRGVEKRMERTKVDADYVLKRVAEIDRMSLKDILDEGGRRKPVSEWPDVWGEMISSVDFDNDGQIKKIKWPDKLRNLEVIGKHIDVQAFNERLEVQHKGSVGECTTEELLEIARGREQGK